MAHEELKALYEIDKQHSDTPWEFWEIFDTSQKDWVCEFKFEPSWLKCCRYRRKPDAPVWSDDKEDARKWRELVDFASTSFTDRGIVDKLHSLNSPQSQLIQGYTREQWQRIIDEGFLCEFADDFSKGFSIIASLVLLDKSGPRSFVRGGCDFPHRFKECRPLRTKGVRQPWFGGECPVPKDSMVLIKLRNGKDHAIRRAVNFNWNHREDAADIVEFIEL